MLVKNDLSGLNNPKAINKIIIFQLESKNEKWQKFHIVTLDNNLLSRSYYKIKTLLKYLLHVKLIVLTGALDDGIEIDKLTFVYSDNQEFLNFALFRA